MKEENLLTQTIPRSKGNLPKPQVQPRAIQLRATENIIIFTHTRRDGAAGTSLKHTLPLQIWIKCTCPLYLEVVKVHNHFMAPLPGKR